MFRLTSVLFYLSLFLMVSCQQRDEYQSRAEEIFPPVKMDYVALYRIDNLPVSPAFFGGQWTIVIFGTSTCDSDCLNRLALINDIKDTKKLFVVDGLAKHTDMREIARSFSNVAVTMGTTARSFDKFSGQFDIETIDPAQKHKQIYLVNPLKELVHIVPQQGLTAADLDKEIVLLKRG